MVISEFKVNAFDQAFDQGAWMQCFGLRGLHQSAQRFKGFRHRGQGFRGFKGVEPVASGIQRLPCFRSLMRNLPWQGWAEFASLHQILGTGILEGLDPVDGPEV